MHEQIKQVIDSIAQFATDLISVRNELLLEGEFDVHEEFPEVILELSNELIDRYHALREIAGETEEELDFVPDEEEEDATPLETARYQIDFLDKRSMTQFSKDAGITRDTLKRFMSGTVRPHVKTLRGIEKALGLKEGALDE